MVNGAITIDDIKLLISTGEGFNVEFKTSVPLILGLFARMNLVEQLGSCRLR